MSATPQRRQDAPGKRYRNQLGHIEMGRSGARGRRDREEYDPDALPEDVHAVVGLDESQHGCGPLAKG